MIDAGSRDDRTVTLTVRAGRWLAAACWATGLSPLVAGCLFTFGQDRPGDVLGLACTATLCLSAACTVPGIIYRAAAEAVDRLDAWGAAVIIGMATLHAAAAGWVAYWMVQALVDAQSTTELLAVLVVLLLATISLVVAASAVVFAWGAVGAIRRLSDPSRPLGFAPVMPAQVLPGPPFGEARPRAAPGADDRHHQGRDGLT